MSGGVKFPESIKNGAKKQKIIYKDNGQLIKFIGSPEKVYAMYQWIKSKPELDWKGVLDYTLWARIKRFFRELKEIKKETCCIGYRPKEQPKGDDQ